MRFRRHRQRELIQKRKEKEARHVEIVGPFCYLHQKPHGEPFAKTSRGKERREARRAKRKILQEMTT